MKFCPYCQNPIPENKSACPACGAVYWDPSHPATGEKHDEERNQEEEQGCLPILLIPFLLATLIAIVLIVAGFTIQLVTHFENNQIKIIWIAGSLLAGIICYRLFQRFHKTKNKE